MTSLQGAFASCHTPMGHSHHGILPSGHLHHDMHHGDICITAYPQGGICIIAYLQGYICIPTRGHSRHGILLSGHSHHDILSRRHLHSLHTQMGIRIHCIPIKGHSRHGILPSGHSHHDMHHGDIRIITCTNGIFASWHAPWGHLHHGIPTRVH